MAATFTFVVLMTSFGSCRRDKEQTGAWKADSNDDAGFFWGVDMRGPKIKKTNKEQGIHKKVQGKKRGCVGEVNRVFH